MEIDDNDTASRRAGTFRRPPPASPPLSSSGSLVGSLAAWAAALLLFMASPPAGAAEWVYRALDDPNGRATGRILFQGPAVDATPDAYAAFTIVEAADPRLFLFVQLPLPTAAIDGRPSAYFGRQNDGRLESFLPIYRPGDGDACAAGQDSASNCTMHCAVEKESAPRAGCRAEGGDPPWLQFRAEFDRDQIAAFLDSADSWNALWFEGAQVFLPLDGLAAALCATSQTWAPACGGGSLATALSGPDGPAERVTCGYRGRAGAWNARIEEVHLSRKDVELHLRIDGEEQGLPLRTSEAFSVEAVEVSYFHPSGALRIVLPRPMFKGYPVQEDVFNPYWAGLLEVDLELRSGGDVRSLGLTAERSNFDGTIVIETEADWLARRLSAGEGVEVRIVLKDALELETALPADGFAALLDEGFPAVAPIAANQAAGLCR